MGYADVQYYSIRSSEDWWLINSSTDGGTKDLVTVTTYKYSIIVLVAHTYYVVKLIMQLTYISATFIMELITYICNSSKIIGVISSCLALQFYM